MSTEKTFSLIFNTLKTHLKRGAGQAEPSVLNVPANMKHWRFLSDNPVLYKNAINAAETYVSKLEVGNIGWLHSKPFDPMPGNPQYFRLMFDLMNILQVMQIPVQGKILEIGSGPGWVTEILLMLGYTVEAVEPSGDLIKIAQERCAGLHPHYRHATPPKVRFHQSTLEEIEFEDESFDAILYFDVLHHVVDETVAMEKSFRFLKPGGVLGVVEGAWHPDFKELEAVLMAEMAEYGTLENPFSTDYLDYLLSKSGFNEIVRYVGVNGFFTKNQLSQPIRSFAACPIAGSNNLTARKPTNQDNPYPSCTNFNFKTDAHIKLLDGGIDRVSRTATVWIECKNTGDTLLDSRPTSTGHITFALRQGIPGSKAFVECKERHLLSNTLIPGQTVKMKLQFTLPPEVTLNHWELDAVAEGVFWFSSRDIKSCPVACL